MLVNKLVALPTQETLDYLATVFSGCPFDVNLEALCVELNTSTYPMVAEPERMYSATCATMDVFYDSSIGQSALILPLRSVGLAERFLELQASAPDAFGRTSYFPHVTMVEPMPPIPRHWRGFINSVSSSLMNGGQPLVFNAEMVIPTEVHGVPDADYYESQQALARIDANPF